MSTEDAVLIVDDRPDNLLALEAVLEPLDVRVVRASSGAEALKRLLTEEFAVILLDVQMPGLDGFETARLIKGREKTRHVPIIFLTAISREVEHQLRGYGSGAVDYLSKPFEPVVLQSKVSVFVALHRQTRLIAEQKDLLARRLEELHRAQAALARQSAELERSNAELERFALVASHELREPLLVLSGLLELVADRQGRRHDGESADLVDRARAGVTRICELLDRLLDYARVTGAGFEPTTVPLDEVLGEAREELAGRIEETDARVTADPLPTVSGDPWQLRNLFVHLLDNALRYRAGPPEVHVGLSRRDGQWVVSVTDNGVGMSDDQLARLFTVFTRLHPVDGRPGAGLGLALCRRVVERHGGSIWAESVPGKGTTVSFSLPAGEG